MVMVITLFSLDYRRHYESTAALLFTMAVFILALGPLSITIVNYGVTFMFAVITMQQICDKEEAKNSPNLQEKPDDGIEKEKDSANKEERPSEESQEEKCDENTDRTSETSEMEDAREDCDVCSESRILNVIKRLRDKLSYTENM